MKQIIKRVTYNTDTSDIIGGHNVGKYGDADGYEEKLYRTKRGAYFLYGLGGVESKYTKETILPLTALEAKAWKQQHLSD